jgi:Effector-associated domain 11
MSAKLIRDKVFAALAKGDIEGALVLLLSYLREGESSMQHDSALMIKAKWETMKRDNLNGTISRTDYNLEQAKTIAGIQALANELVPNDRYPNYGAPTQLPARKNNKWIFIAGAILLIALSVVAFKAFNHGGQEAKNQTSPNNTKLSAPQKHDDYDRLVGEAQKFYDEGKYKMASDTNDEALRIDRKDKKRAEELKKLIQGKIDSQVSMNQRESNDRDAISAGKSAFERGDINTAINWFMKANVGADRWLNICRNIKNRTGATYITKNIKNGEKISGSSMKFYGVTSKSVEDFSNMAHYPNIWATKDLPTGSILTWDNIRTH